MTYILSKALFKLKLFLVGSLLSKEILVKENMYLVERFIMFSNSFIFFVFFCNDFGGSCCFAQLSIYASSLYSFPQKYIDVTTPLS